MLPEDWKRVAHHPAIDDPDFTLSLEEYRNGAHQMMFIDLGVRRWSPGMLRRFADGWKIFRKHITCPLFAFPDVDDGKWEKFVTRFGFKPLSTIQCTDGSFRRIFWHPGI